MVQPGWKRVWRFAKELKVEVAYGSAVPLPGIDPPPVQANKLDAPFGHMDLCARSHAHARSPARLGVGRGLGLWLESVQAPGLPEASQRSPRGRRDGRSSGFLKAESEGGGARGPRGGNPGLQRESGPRPPTHSPRPGRGWGCGGGGGARGVWVQELGRGAGAKGPLLVGKKASSTRNSQVVSHPRY